MKAKRVRAPLCAARVKTIVSNNFNFLSVFVVALLLLFSSVMTGYAAQVTLAWDAVNDPGVIGYKLYYGKVPGVYTTSIDTGSITSATVDGLTEGDTYYFASTAYDSAGDQSGYSNQVSESVPITTQYSLAIAQNGSGAGTVTGSGINCGNVCTDSYAPGTVVTLDATPASGSIFAGWAGAGCSGTGTCTVTMNQSSSVTATFNSSAVTYNINTTASGDGLITALNNPNVSQGTNGSATVGIVTVTKGANQQFSITPNNGNYTASVSVDGAVVASNLGNYSYTFNSVSANHTLNATFAVATYSITPSSGSGGSISPASVLVNHGGSQVFSITPDSGYTVADVKVDGVSVGAVTSYTFSNVTANHTISATFKTTTSSYSITASSTSGGSISPAGTVAVSGGVSKSFTITPNTGYYTASVSVDGSVVATNQGNYSYTFSNVAANHTIDATFAVATYSITPSAGTGGSISPTSAVINYGDSQTFSITPNSGYTVAEVKVDGTSIGAVSSYTFNNVSANHTISATFTSNTSSSSYSITASSSSGGSISPSGTVTISGGASKSFTFNPRKHHRVSDVQVDGVSKGAISSYTFSNIAADHTIQVIFRR